MLSSLVFVCLIPSWLALYPVDHPLSLLTQKKKQKECPCYPTPAQSGQWRWKLKLSSPSYCVCTKRGFLAPWNFIHISKKLCIPTLNFHMNSKSSLSRKKSFVFFFCTVGKRYHTKNKRIDGTETHDNFSLFYQSLLLRTTLSRLWSIIPRSTYLSCNLLFLFSWI